MNISLIAVVYNEAERLEYALQQFVGHVSDMVVYNTESTDDTERIARQFTHKVYRVPYISTPDPYMESAMLKADNDWCIIACPDEEWPSELLSRLGGYIEGAGVGLAFLRSENGVVDESYHFRVVNKRRLDFYPDIGDFEFMMEYGDGIKKIPESFTHRRSEVEMRIDAQFRIDSRPYIVEKYKFTKMEPYASRINGYRKESEENETQ